MEILGYPGFIQVMDHDFVILVKPMGTWPPQALDPSAAATCPPSIPALQPPSTEPGIQPTTKPQATPWEIK